MRSRRIMSWTRIDDLHGSARIQQCLHVVDADRRQIGELFLLKWLRWAHFRSIVVSFLYRTPVDIAHKGRDIGFGICPELDLIGVLVHVDGENRNAAGDVLTVI